MTHDDAFSRNPLPVCLVIDESETGLTARLQKAQEEDDNVKLRELLQDKTRDYVIRSSLLYKESSGDIQLVVPKRMYTQIIRCAHEQGHFSDKED